MVEGFAAIAGGFERDGNIFFDAFLADVFGKGFGANAGVEACVVFVRRAGDNALLLAILHHAFCARVGHRSPYFLHRAEMRLNMFTPYVPARVALPFGSERTCSETRSNFSKFETPASRLPSPPAFSAVRPSWRGLVGAVTASASTPAGDGSA